MHAILFGLLNRASAIFAELMGASPGEVTPWSTPAPVPVKERTLSRDAVSKQTRVRRCRW
jgi:hypothetical protein